MNFYTDSNRLTQYRGIKLVKGLVQDSARISMDHITRIFEKRTTSDQTCIQMFEAILDGGFDVNTEFGFTGDALLAAVSRNDVLIVELLLRRGADPNLNLCAERWTSIELAALSAGPEVIDVLLRYGANLKGRQALQMAAFKGRIEIVEHLLDCGADIDGTSEGDDIYDGYRLGTALHVAAVYNKEESVAVLLRYGANKSVRNSEGQTALEIAQEKGYTEIVQLLE